MWGERNICLKKFLGNHMTHDYLIAWRSSEFLVLLSWQIMTLILKVVFIRLRGHHLLTADCPMDGRHINELIWDRNSSFRVFTCSRHRNLQYIRILQIFVLISLMILQQTIWGRLEKNIRLEFRKGCVIPEQFTLLLIKQKNHNKRFGEFEYFWGSDVENKLDILG